MYVIRLLNGNSAHFANKIKKLYNQGSFDEATHVKYHEYLENLYVSEYIKKSSMVKYTEVYVEASTPILDQEFSKDSKNNEVDVPTLEVLREVEARLKTFMDEKALRSKVYLTKNSNRLKTTTVLLVPYP